MTNELDTLYIFLFLITISLVGGLVNYCLRRGVQRKERRGAVFFCHSY